MSEAMFTTTVTDTRFWRQPDGRWSAQYMEGQEYRVTKVEQELLESAYQAGLSSHIESVREDVQLISLSFLYAVEMRHVDEKHGKVNFTQCEHEKCARFRESGIYNKAQTLAILTMERKEKKS